MSRVMTVWLLLMTVGPAWAAPGDPVVGQKVGVDRHIVGVRWDGTDDDASHQQEGAMLGGFTLFASYSPGGPVIARLPFAWPPPPPTNPEETGGPPVFFVPFVPDGRYYVLVVRGLIDTPSPSIPTNAWSEVVVNVITCGAPPNAPVNLLGAAPIPGGSLFVTFGWSDAPGGCPPEIWELVAGYAPGEANAASIRVAGRLFQTVAPPGTYYVRIHALNQFGRSGPSNEVQIVVNSAACVPPGIPPNLTATVNGNQVTLNWGAADPAGLPISFYHIAAGSLPSLSNLANIRVPGNTTSFTTPAPPGRYYVRVQAGNGCAGTFETGLPSNEVIIDVP